MFKIKRTFFINNLHTIKFNIKNVVLRQKSTQASSLDIKESLTLSNLPLINDINTDGEKQLHIPVMLDTVLKYLVKDVEVSNYKIYLDMTFGAGGHTKSILKTNPNSIVYALDRDPSAFELAKELKGKYPGRIFPMNGKFSDLPKLLSEYGVKENSIDAALIDCGVSSIQFDTADRGFSISHDGPLDMRMSFNKESGSVKAEDVVNKLDEESLGILLWKYGEERMYKKIAHGIVYFRNSHGPIKTTRQFADLIRSVIKDVRTDSLDRKSHVATKSFQAIRIFVNNELNELYNGITQLHSYLKPGGRLVAISFHSLEDRVIKGHFHEVDLNLLNEEDFETNGGGESGKKSTITKKKFNRLSNKFKMNSCRTNIETFNSLVSKMWIPLSKKVILPSDEEIKMNARSRSAKLRVAIKNE